MKDRISTKILPNGAIRYGIYDESGALIRYEYIRPEDEPTEAGTPLSKANLMTDATEVAIFGDAADRNVSDVLAAIGIKAVRFAASGEDYSLSDIFGGFIGKTMRVESGTYTGTGTYGAANATVLNFGFAPKIVFVLGFDGARGALGVLLPKYGYGLVMGTHHDASGYASPSTNTTLSSSGIGSWVPTVIANGNAVSFYHPKSAAAGLNRNDTEHYYIAIG